MAVVGEECMKNPGYEENRCFVCGTRNPMGLQLTFRLDTDTGVVRSEFVPQRNHQGYDGVVHGGILASLMDDAMANCLWLRGIAAVTAKMELRYRSPVAVGERLLIYGRLLQERDKVALAEGWLTTSTGTRLVEATGTFFKRSAES
ncbi:MAG: PaaI family thioesterase [Candidatus Tectomicrobia bacterium]